MKNEKYRLAFSKPVFFILLFFIFHLFLYLCSEFKIIGN